MAKITYLVEHDEDKDELKEEVSDGEADKDPEVHSITEINLHRRA